MTVPVPGVRRTATIKFKATEVRAQKLSALLGPGRVVVKLPGTPPAHGDGSVASVGSGRSGAGVGLRSVAEQASPVTQMAGVGVCGAQRTYAHPDPGGSDGPDHDAPSQGRP